MKEYLNRKEEEIIKELLGNLNSTYKVLALEELEGGGKLCLILDKRCSTLGSNIMFDGNFFNIDYNRIAENWESGFCSWMPETYSLIDYLCQLNDKITNLRISTEKIFIYLKEMFLGYQNGYQISM